MIWPRMSISYPRIVFNIKSDPIMVPNSSLISLYENFHHTLCGILAEVGDLRTSTKYRGVYRVLIALKGQYTDRYLRRYRPRKLRFVVVLWPYTIFELITNSLILLRFYSVLKVLRGFVVKGTKVPLPLWNQS